MPFARLRTTALALLLVALSVPATRAQEEDVIPPKVTVRQFPQGVFCALPIAITFTAPATPVRITFTALQWVDDGAGGLAFTDQAIDNVTVATTAQVAVHSGIGDIPPSDCYDSGNSPPTYFYFNDPGLTVPLLHTFDTGPQGWDTPAGVSWQALRSAPKVVRTREDDSGGCLVIGDGVGTEVPGVTKSTSFLLSGLQEGESYDLGAWWEANHVRFPHDTVYLTITITTGTSTVVARKSWGAVKQLYR